ncbi:MAG: 2Fe-2S iron-sulfur cluster binding domain-containing protein [Kineosporiaceae bacterium]|nr:2Fe-2S iron-sulfur cluster binding domain-containing protein [Kineosporiaceae bacterium]
MTTVSGAGTPTDPVGGDRRGVPAHRVTVVGGAAGGEATFEVAEGERIHAAARRAGVWLPFECGWGSCGTCKATLVEGQVVSLFPQAPAIDARDERRRRVLLCQSTTTADLVVKTTRVESRPPPERPVRDLRARLAETEPLAPGISRFRFRLTDDSGSPVAADYRPGQYAVLELAPGLRRCLSMAGPPGEDQVEFIAKCYPGGEGSQRLFALHRGDQIPVELPYGDMWLRPAEEAPGRPTVLVAGGTGISAILALVRQVAAEASSRPVDVVYGAATLTDLVCWEELTRLVSPLGNARVHGAVLDCGPGWSGTVGLVTDALDPVLARAPSPEVYLAGPPPMVRAVQEQLDRHAVGRDRVHVDSFG